MQDYVQRLSALTTVKQLSSHMCMDYFLLILDHIALHAHAVVFLCKPMYQGEIYLDRIYGKL